ncbi:MAG: McrC family protein [Anaerolineaceae bacterium]|nr:McrC family protein [Anaerolineaceae bacterium]
MDNSLPIILEEYKTIQIPENLISDEFGYRLWEKFNERISVVPPSFKNNRNWELTSLGWVGFLPFSEELNFYLKPKVALQNLFGMWEYAYRLRSIEFLPNLFQCQTLQEFYEQLANILSKRIIDRGRKGYYRAYISRSEDLSFIRGKLDVNRMINKPWVVQPRCNYQENTADVIENRLLTWTLNTILRSGYCGNDQVLSTIRHGYRNIGHITTLQPFSPLDCVGRTYNRLNQDYQPLHALCRFFLENSGPSYESGDRTMLPFMVNMARLFELFVAEWLIVHLPERYQLEKQESVKFGQSGDISFLIDLVISDKETGKPLCVLDTKYKTPITPSQEDIAQIYLYAGIKKCNEGILIYPSDLEKPLDTLIDGTRIRTSTFSLKGNLEEAGQQLLIDILPD